MGASTLVKWQRVVVVVVGSEGTVFVDGTAAHVHIDAVKWRDDKSNNSNATNGIARRGPTWERALRGTLRPSDRCCVTPRLLCSMSHGVFIICDRLSLPPPPRLTSSPSRSSRPLRQSRLPGSSPGTSPSITVVALYIISLLLSFVLNLSALQCLAP